MRLTVIITFIILSSQAWAAEGSSKTLNGTTLAVQEESDMVHQVLLDGKVLYVDRDNRFVDVVGIYDDGGHLFGLVAHMSGGNACPSLYRAVDITTRKIVSEEFGTCSDLPRDIGASKGGLHVTVPRMDGIGSETYTYSAGHLNKTVHMDRFVTSGTAKAPDNDLAALVDGKSIFDVVKTRAIATALSKTMGSAMFTSSRKRVQGGVGGNFESRGEFTFSSACVPHSCGIDETAWAFDHLGHAWASWTDNSRTQYFGNPPPAVKAALTPSR